LELLQWQGDYYIQQPLMGGIQPCYVIVIWIAYITSAARIQVWEALVRQGESATYCDSDSVMGKVKIKTGPELGQWGRQFGPSSIEVRAEKYYRYQGDNGDWTYRKASVRADRQAEFWEEGKTFWYRPTKLGEAMVSGSRVSIWKWQPKKDLPRHFKRCPLADDWREGEAIATRPWDYEEAKAYYKDAPAILPWREGGDIEDDIRRDWELRVLRDWVKHQQIENRSWERGDR